MTELLHDGVLFVCMLDDITENGSKPHQTLRKIQRHWYGERMVGYGRYYAALGVNEEIDMLVRIHHDRRVRIGMFAVLGNGEQFRITNVQQLIADDGLRCTDLTLRRLEKNYDLTE